MLVPDLVFDLIPRVAKKVLPIKLVYADRFQMRFIEALRVEEARPPSVYCFLCYDGLIFREGWLARVRGPLTGWLNLKLEPEPSEVFMIGPIDPVAVENIPDDLWGRPLGASEIQTLGVPRENDQDGQ